jgi:chemotaxis protein histidine kinase CheA
MTADLFADRLAKIRGRFAARLPNMIDENEAAMSTVTRDGAEGIETVAKTYRRLHTIAGTGTTIGLAATGRAARNAETILIEAYRSRRALNTSEVASLREALVALRQAAQGELLVSPPR